MCGKSGLGVHVSDIRLLRVIEQTDILSGVRKFNSYRTAARHLVEARLMPITISRSVTARTEVQNQIVAQRARARRRFADGDSICQDENAFIVAVGIHLAQAITSTGLTADKQMV